LVESIKVSKTPSFQRLLLCPIKTRNEFTKRLAKPEHGVARGRGTPTEISLYSGFQRAPIRQCPGIEADAAEARRHAKIAALLIGR
jgi:hypothetical protein